MVSRSVHGPVGEDAVKLDPQPSWWNRATQLVPRPHHVISDNVSICKLYCVYTTLTHTH